MTECTQPLCESKPARHAGGIQALMSRHRASGGLGLPSISPEAFLIGGIVVLLFWHTVG